MENESKITRIAFGRWLLLSIGSLLLMIGVAAALWFWQVQTMLFQFNHNTQLTLQSQQQISRLHNLVHLSQSILQEYLLSQQPEMELRRNRLWAGDVQPLIDSLNRQKAAWQNEEWRMGYENLLIQLKKLQLLQTEIADLIQNPAEASSPEDEEFIKAINPTTLYQRKNPDVWREVQMQFGRLYGQLARDIDTQKRDEVQMMRYYGGLGAAIFLLLALVMGFMGRQLLRRFYTDVRGLLRYTDALKRGNLPAPSDITTDEVGAIHQHLHTLTTELRAIKQFADNVGKGDLSQPLRIFEPNSDLGTALTEMHLGLTRIAIRDQQRNWVNEGIALFSDMLREYNAPQKLYDDLIAGLVKYVQASQGGIFIVNSTQDRLELQSVYAYDRKRFIEKSILPGQGLIGQAWREKSTLYLQETAEDFVEISSGLGGASPKSVLIVPMINPDSLVLGVLEIASFHHFEEYEIEFVKRVGEMIVSAISAIQSNARNQELLAEAQRATVQMRRQELEMRQHLQAVMEAQAHTERSQAELSGQMTAMNLTLAIAEMDFQGRIIFTNPNFERLLNATSEDLRGLLYVHLLSEDDFIYSDYPIFWQNLRDGIPQMREIKLSTDQRRAVWLYASYAPVKDQSGKVTKIIQLAIDLTDQKEAFLHHQSQIEAIERTNLIVEFDLQGNILHVNEAYLRLSKYTLRELQGQPHHLLIPVEEKEQRFYQNFWDNLRQAHFITGVFKRVAKDGASFWIKGSYNILYDVYGKPYRALMIAQDMNAERQLENELRQQVLTLRQQQEDFWDKSHLTTGAVSSHDGLR